MRKLKGKRVSKKTGYRMEMKGYSCEVKDDGGSFRERKYEKQRRYGGGGGERSDAQDCRWKSPVREQLSLCGDGGSSKTNDLVQLRIGHLRLAYI